MRIVDTDRLWTAREEGQGTQQPGESDEVSKREVISYAQATTCAQATT